MNLDFLLTEKIINLSFQYDWLDILGIFFAEYSDYIFIFLAFLLLFWNYKAVILGFISGLFSRYVLVVLIRFFIEKPRPFLFFENVLAQVKHTNAFPSGHATFYFAFSTLIYFYNKKIGISFFILSFLMSFSRIFVGYHWVFDIIGGLLVGILTGVVVKELWKIFMRNS